ncbi:MAG: UDP-N-acetylmuramate--L-alanine ligase, UDP-N-acetylmuramate--alanine ligase [Candidatus Parcubacteria bacterium]|jgi:UDP-N-acetylmuramate--alanine ligase
MSKHIHFIGIGGIGMSALARFWHHEGAVVTGSDREASLITHGLEELGIVINYNQENTTIYSSNLDSEYPIDIVVYTEAMPHDHPEMVAARALGVPMMNYFEALGQVANEYYLIAIAGSHGKTTTTAMTIDILEEAGLDPTGIVGSLRSKTKSNFRAGKSKYAVVEACEYKRDYLHLEPDVLIITNIEYEHVDYYKDLADVQSAFRELALKVPENGAIVANVTDPNIAPVLAGLQTNIIDYRPQIDLGLKLRHPGMHNRMNAAAARTAAEFVGVETAKVNEALEWFAGTWRRFEYKGEVNGAPVYDDYGHHPTELRATFAGVRELYPDHRLKVVFQSHTYSRTAELFDDFVTVLATADEVSLLPIYAAREENTWGVTSEKLAAAIVTKGIPCTVYQTIPACAQAVKDSLSYEKKEVVLVIGAGAVTEVATLLTQ